MSQITFVARNGDENAATRQMSNVSRRNNGYFGAESLYLHCSPISHPLDFTKNHK
jgi:hypothetical protein